MLALLGCGERASGQCTSAQRAVVMGSSSSLPCTQTPGVGPGFLAWGAWLVGALTFLEKGGRRSRSDFHLPYGPLMTPWLDPFWGPCLLSPIE